MIGFCRDVVEAARADQRARRALVWECVALQHQLAVLRRSGTRRPRFRPIDRLFWVFMSWWWPAWRDGLNVIQPETVLRWRRLGIALIWKYRSRGRWRGGRPRIALETRQLIREMARANFLWGAPRIHGELLKLGITVSQATVSRYMPTSRKDRRSQAWRTFIRNHAITIVQSHSFNGQNWARDLLSQVRSRLRVFMYHLSTSAVAPAAGPSGCAVWHTVHPLRSRSSSACLVYQNCNSDYQIHRAGVSQLATRKVGLLTIDRIRDSPTPTRAETSRGPLINALNSRTRVFARSTRRHSTASSTNRAYSRSAIGASNCHPRPASASHIWNYVFEVPGCAAHVLRNDRRSASAIDAAIDALISRLLRRKPFSACG
jgi:hypothetical protein